VPCPGNEENAPCGGLAVRIRTRGGSALAGAQHPAGRERPHDQWESRSVRQPPFGSLTRSAGVLACTRPSARPSSDPPGHVDDQNRVRVVNRSTITWRRPPRTRVGAPHRPVQRPLRQQHGHERSVAVRRGSMRPNRPAMPSRGRDPRSGLTSSEVVHNRRRSCGGRVLPTRHDARSPTAPPLAIATHRHAASYIKFDVGTASSLCRTQLDGLHRRST
jgi:hypothetical protein